MFISRFALSLVAGAVVVTATARAQTAAAINGRVVDENGRPVLNVQLTLIPTSARAISLDDGRFTIPGVGAGVYVLTARRIGYEPQDVNVIVTGSAAAITVTLVAIPEQLNAIQVREKSVGIQYSAVVLDQNDIPVEGAEVVAMGVASDLRTDMLGRVTVPKVRIGTLTLRVRKIGYEAYFGSIRVLAERADTIRMPRLATSLGQVEINERSGFGADASLYEELNQRTRWKASGAGAISREELAEQGKANLCDTFSHTPSGSRYVAVTPRDCYRRTYRVLVNGSFCETRRLSDFPADQVETVEYFPAPSSKYVTLLKSDASGTLSLHNCEPVYDDPVFVVWMRHGSVPLTNVAAAVAPATDTTAAASAPGSQLLPVDSVQGVISRSHLQGQVVDSTGHPVRAAVIYTEDPPRATLSDKKGYFSLAGLPAGATTVRVQRGGYVAIDFQLRLPPDTTVGIGVKLVSSKPLFGTVQVDSSDGSATGAPRKVRVLAAEGGPIAYANVLVEGGNRQITDEQGLLSFVGGKRQAFTISVTRIGYAPWYGKVDLPPAAVMTVTLPRIAHGLAPVTVTGTASSPVDLGRRDFYSHWMMRQNGALSGVFIGPEEIELRHPSKVTQLLQGLNGVMLRCSATGECRVLSTRIGSVLTTDECRMAIVLDGKQIYDASSVDLLVNASDVMGVEVYARGGNMPVDLQVNDTKCGVVAFWSGSRKP